MEPQNSGRYSEVVFNSGLTVCQLARSEIRIAAESAEGNNLKLSKILCSESSLNKNLISKYN